MVEKVLKGSPKYYLWILRQCARQGNTLLLSA